MNYRNAEKMINLVTTKKCSKIFEIVLTICQIRYKIASTKNEQKFKQGGI